MSTSIQNATVPSITSLSPLGPFLTSSSSSLLQRQISSTKPPQVEQATASAIPQVQRPEFQVFSFFPTIRPEADRSGGSVAAVPAAARDPPTASAPPPARAEASLSVGVKRPGVVRPSGSPRTLPSGDAEQVLSADLPSTRFPPAARIAPQQPTKSRQPPTAFQDLPADKEEEELFVFRRPEPKESSSAALVTGNQHQLQVDIVQPQQAQSRNFNLDDIFVFKPNNRTPLSRLVFEDYADETVDRPSILTVESGSRQQSTALPVSRQPSFSFFPAVTPHPVEMSSTKQDLFRPLESQLTFSSDPSSSLFSFTGSNHLDVREPNDDIVVNSQLIGLVSPTLSEPRPVASLVSSFVEDSAGGNNFAVVRASTNLTPDTTGPDQLTAFQQATTTPRYNVLCCVHVFVVKSTFKCGCG